MDKITPATTTMILGTAFSAGSTLAEGKSQEQAAQYTAAQLRQNAGQEQAAAQRAAAEDIRIAELNISRAIAVAGASGAGVTDPTVLNIIAGLNADGQLASLTSLYEGDSRAAGMRRQATAVEFEGAAARRASKTRVIGTVLQGAYNAFGGTVGPMRTSKSKYALPTGSKAFGAKPPRSTNGDYFSLKAR